MRLTCPNCGAQYEVPAEVIPEAGRDVQCSNCNDTWFQPHPDSEPDIQDESLQAHFARRDSELSGSTEEAEPEIFEQESGSSQEEIATTLNDDMAQSVADAEAELSETLPDEFESDEAAEDLGQVTPNWDEPEEVRASTKEDTAETEDEHGPDLEAEPVHPEPTPAPAPRDIDPAIARILREEAEWEQEARKKEAAGGLEVQQDLGLPSPQTALPETETQPRVVQVADRTEAIADEPAYSSRRDLFPDIEEITSSLGSDEDHVPMREPEASSAEKKRGFKSGFLLAVLVFVTATVIYVTADDIGQSFPSMEGAMSSYSDAVDAGRLKLQESASGLKGWFSQMSEPTAE
ncbi:hypothetical protein ROA7450_01252 [Roseovarius albus]|uniref:Zinc finger/thioredoxin putative domain-containing protein n=1 Tax=Roseovarius albus TaxID=1247867 RepID=A0A1X6YTZ4_9RHOB|nr:zinc-ribbon domain-containing protein [Roseovarius albus]SLN29270.1 hypothetical protein ROA7450_01252 [Roseovarius albus]